MREVGTKVHPCRRGFTLLELLVLLAVVGVLVILLIPAIQQSREVARRTQCGGKLARLGLALQNYQVVHNTVPSGWIGVADGAPAVHGANAAGWGVMLLPEIDQAALYENFNPALDVRDPANAPFRQTLVPGFICPSDQFRKAWDVEGKNLKLASGNYVGVMGSAPCQVQENGQCVSDGMFFHNSAVSLDGLDDETSTTLLAGERGAPSPDGPFSSWVGAVPKWEVCLGVAKAPFPSPPQATDSFSSYHPEGVNLLYCDGHVSFTSNAVNEGVLKTEASRSKPTSSNDF